MPVFNSAMLTGQTDDIERLIATADLHFRAKKAGWTFWVCEDLLPANMRNSALQDIFLERVCAGSPSLRVCTRISSLHRQNRRRR